jgi:hypothetical protein
MKKKMVLSVAIVLLATAVQSRAGIPIPARYYSFENDLNDVITGGNPAVLGGGGYRVAWEPAAGASAVILPDDGTNTLISVSNFPIANGATDWTISFWVRASQLYDGSGILSFGGTSTLFLDVNYWGGTTPWLYLASTGYKAWGGPTMAKEAWTFVTLTASAAGGLKIYVAPKTSDIVGSPVCQGTGALNSSDTLYLGTLCVTDYYWGKFPGMFDELTIWDRGLTEAEVGEVFLKGKAGLLLLDETQAPVFTPDEIYISSATPITITSPTENAHIYYTIDGTLPTARSIPYTGPVTVTPGMALKAIALAEGYRPSCITGTTYVAPTIPIVAWGGIPISMSTTPARFQEMREAGFTHCLYQELWDPRLVQMALDSAREAGIKITVSAAEPLNQFIPRFKDHPALWMYYLMDEPDVSKFSSLATQVRNIKSLDASHGCYINLLPCIADATQFGVSTYEDYVNTFLNTVPVDLLSFDFYPIVNGATKPNAEYYHNLEIISKAAKQAGMPFWGFALTTALGNYPIPNMAQLRFEVYSNLAYGAQGIQYFTYWSLWDLTTGPIDPNGNRSAVYYLVQSLNQEIKGLSKVFLGAKVVDVSHTGSILPVGTKAYQAKSPILRLTTGGTGAVVSTLIKDTSWYLAIVNRDFINPMTLNLTVDVRRGVSRVSKDGMVTLLGSGTVAYTVDPGDIVVLKWNVIPGDANWDEAVNIGDLGILAANYGTTSGATWAKGDFNGDGAVDVGDLGILAANYGKGASGADFDADYAKVFGSTAMDDTSVEDTENETTSSVCSGLGLSLVAGLAFMGLMLVKLRE